MEGMEPMITAISTVGFPIAACCGLFYLYDKTTNKVIVALKELTDILDELKDDYERRREVKE